jgi:hypothetical protein
MVVVKLGLDATGCARRVEMKRVCRLVVVVAGVELVCLLGARAARALGVRRRMRLRYWRGRDAAEDVVRTMI